MNFYEGKSVQTKMDLDKNEEEPRSVSAASTKLSMKKNFSLFNLCFPCCFQTDNIKLNQEDLINNKKRQNDLEKILNFQEKEIPTKRKKKNKVKKIKKEIFNFHSNILCYPKDQIFLLENDNYSILAKIKEKNFNYISNKKSNKNENKYENLHRIFYKYGGKITDLFSQYKSGMKIDSDDISCSIPEKIIQYLAKKTVNISDFIIDAFTFTGLNAILVN